MKTSNVFGYTLNSRWIEKPLTSRASFMSKVTGIVTAIKGDCESSRERFLRIMMKLSIIKLVAALITLIVMTVLLIKHLHVFDSITLQFSQWISSPIICFIMFVIAVKFAGISIGLTLTVMSVKKITFENIKFRLREYGKLRLRVFSLKNVQQRRV